MFDFSFWVVESLENDHFFVHFVFSFSSRLAVCVQGFLCALIDPVLQTLTLWPLCTCRVRSMRRSTCWSISDETGTAGSAIGTASNKMWVTVWIPFGFTHPRSWRKMRQWDLIYFCIEFPFFGGHLAASFGEEPAFFQTWNCWNLWCTFGLALEVELPEARKQNAVWWRWPPFPFWLDRNLFQTPNDLELWMSTVLVIRGAHWAGVSSKTKNAQDDLVVAESQNINLTIWWMALNAKYSVWKRMTCA